MIVNKRSASLFATLLLAVPYIASATHEAGHTDAATDTQTTTQTDSAPAATPLPESTAAAYQFKNEGIFGCNQAAGANASAGTMAAIGGVYVPVNDAAVTLNTGILVYKECVLRPLQDRLRESAVSALLKKQYVGIETGREGNKRYVVDQGAEELIVSDKVAYATLTDGTLDALNPAYKAAVQRALITNYQAETRSNKDLECKYNGDLNADITNPTSRPFSFANFEKLADPACNPFFAYTLAREKLDSRIGQALAYQRAEWDWGRGYYAVTDNPQNPLLAKTLTPASVVQESYQQVLGSSVRQLESANDIGQMIGALFAGVTTQILTDNKGLAGISKSVGGRPSYLDQVAKESSQGVLGAAVNAALTILNAYRGFELRYLTAMEGIATNLAQSINKIRQIERGCWDLVVPKAREYASGNNISLDTNKIRTSTSSLAFSQQTIDSQITPLANAALTNIASSKTALGRIEQLIAGVTNTKSLTTQRLALQQLDTLIADNALHNKQSAEGAEKQREDVASAMGDISKGGLVDDTRIAWADSSDPSTGWCNINNAAIPQLWAERWRR